MKLLFETFNLKNQIRIIQLFSWNTNMGGACTKRKMTKQQIIAQYKNFWLVNR